MNSPKSLLDQRRLRLNPWTRDLNQEFQVRPEKLIQPLFVVEGITSREPIPGLTGVYRETPESLIAQIEKDLNAGIHKFLLFGVPGQKAKDSFSPEFTSKVIRDIKEKFGHRLWLSVDVCLCSSTEHGQCGVLNSTGDYLENDKTVRVLTDFALSYAKSGADCIAPSDMMDGRIGSIRMALDEAGLEQTLIMSYSAKFHSKFYGPFRVAADSAPKGASSKLKDRATYQIDPASPKDALASSLRDAEEGADFLMVKPGLPYLDVLQSLSRAIPKPWAVYEVSGEFAAIELMAEKGLIDAPKAHIEAWTAFFRAGAATVITYGARSATKWLEESRK